MGFSRPGSGELKGGGDGSDGEGIFSNFVLLVGGTDPMELNA